MTTLIIPVVAAAGTAVVLASRRWPAISRVVGLLAIAIVLVVAAFAPDGSLTIGGAGLELTPYASLLLAILAGGSVVIAIVVAASGLSATIPAGLLIGLAGVAVGTTAAGSVVGVWAILAGAAGVLGVALALEHGPGAATGVTGALRAVVISAALAVGGIALAAPTASVVPDATVIGLAYVVVMAGVGVGFAAVPVHGWAARLTDAVPVPLVLVLLVWIPVALAIVALTWADATTAPVVFDLGVERGTLVAAALVTIVLGAVAAWIQDDLGHAFAYLAIADAGVTLLGVSILDPIGWAPTRVWLLAVLASKSALAALVVALELPFGTRRLPELSGWARRAPAVAGGLVLVALATVGWPGAAVLDARLTIVDAAIDGPLAWVTRIAILGVLLAYGRILVVGLGPVDGPVARGEPERPRLPERWSVRAVAGPARRARALAADVRATWRVNRAPVAAAAALALGIVAAGISAGGFGLQAKAAGGPPAATGSGQERPGASPGPTEASPEPSLEPSPSASAEASPSASIEPAPSAEASSSAQASPSEAPVGP